LTRRSSTPARSRVVELDDEDAAELLVRPVRRAGQNQLARRVPHAWPADLPHRPMEASGIVHQGLTVPRPRASSTPIFSAGIKAEVVSFDDLVAAVRWRRPSRAAGFDRREGLRDGRRRYRSPSTCAAPPGHDASSHDHRNESSDLQVTAIRRE
jgi:hypothetical protein